MSRSEGLRDWCALHLKIVVLANGERIVADLLGIHDTRTHPPDHTILHPQCMLLVAR